MTPIVLACWVWMSTTCCRLSDDSVIVWWPIGKPIPVGYCAEEQR